MNRTLYLIIAVLILLGGVGANPAMAAEGCAGKSVGDPCDDDLFCNGADTCELAIVGGQEILGCFEHGGDPCVEECKEFCDESTDSCFDLAGHPCSDDGNPCTDDECDGAGACIHENNIKPCDDGKFCNGRDRCEDGACSIHSGDPCENGPECADDECDEEADNCFQPQGHVCSDEPNPCTEDICDGSGVCAHVPNNEPCDDGLYCNGADACSGGSCSAHTGSPCAGGCVAVCVEATNDCAVPMGTACEDDGNPCTDDVCMNGGCMHTAISGCELCSEASDCDDGNPCTTDECGISGCSNTFLTDCVPCVVDDDCDDADACTVDRCGAQSQCTFDASDCFGAASCPFASALNVDSCAGERIPRSIGRLIDRAGCKVEQAETRARTGRNRIGRKLKLGARSLQRALRKVGRVRGKRISAPCADALAEDLGSRVDRIMLLMDQSLAACTAGLTAGQQASGPSLCSPR
jgi:hypothetical protein